MRDVPGQLDWLRKHFRPEAAAGVEVVYQFDLAGPGGGRFWAAVRGGCLEAAEGTAAAPDVVFRLAAGDYEDVLEGRQNPEMLFMAGRVTLEGDPRLATKVQSLFRALRQRG